MEMDPNAVYWEDRKENTAYIYYFDVQTGGVLSAKQTCYTKAASINGWASADIADNFYLSTEAEITEYYCKKDSLTKVYDHPVEDFGSKKQTVTSFTQMSAPGENVQFAAVTNYGWVYQLDMNGKVFD